MKKFWTAVITLFIVGMMGCATMDSTKRANNKNSCASLVAYENISDEDIVSFKAYLNKGCKLVAIGRSFIEDDMITLKAVERWQIPMICRNPMAAACTYKLGEDEYIIYNPHGHAKHLSHEMLHIIFWEMGLEGDMHHVIMLAKGWY